MRMLNPPPRCIREDRGDRAPRADRRCRREGARSVPTGAFNLLNGRSSLSGIMALRIEKAFGVKMDTRST